MPNIEEKYKIIYLNGRHYYIEDLSKRDYNLENCLPYYLRIEEEEFFESAWIHLLPIVTNYLIDEFDITKEELLNFKTQWTKSKIFNEEEKINNIKLKNGLFMNCNHTALHSCWLLQDLLKYLDISMLNCRFIIRRNPSAENSEVKKYFKEKHKNEFKYYIINKLNKDTVYYDKCIKGIDNTEVIFKKIFPTFESFYYFEDYSYYYNYKKKFIEYLEKNNIADPKIISVYSKILNIYGDYIKAMYK